MSGTYQHHSHDSTAPAVLVVPLNYAGDVLMLRANTALSLPGGLIAEGESAEDAVQRVLRTVTGFKAEALFKLSSPAPDDVTLYLARNLEPTRAMTDPIYQGTTERVPLADIDALIDAERLNDMITIMALFVARSAITGDSHADQEGV